MTRDVAVLPAPPTGDGPRPPASRAREVALAVAVVIAVLWPLRARHLYEWDSVQFALGAREYDVALHQPHPPGYPLWILLVKAASLVTGDPNTAMIALALAFTVVAALALHALARRHLEPPAAWTLVAAIAFSPVVVLYSTVAATYTVDLAASCVVGLLAARALDGDRRAAAAVGVTVAIFAGIRQSGALLLAPLAAFAMVGALRRHPRILAAASAAAAATFAAWFVPAALWNGGPAAFLALGSRTIRGYFGQASVLFGGPAHEHVTMIVQNAVWLPYALAPALTLAALGRVPARAEHDTQPKLPPRGLLALWLIPNLAYVFLLHAPKPGYLALSLPPLGLWLAARGARRAGLAGAVLVAAVGLTLASVRWDAGSSRVTRALHLASLGSVVESDRTLDAVLGLVPRADPHRSLLVTADGRKAGASQRKLSWHLPEHVVVARLGGGLTASVNSRVTPFGDVPASVRRVWWFRAAPDTGADLRDAFPHTELLWSDGDLVVFRSDVGGEPLNARVPVAGQPFRFYREVAPSLGDGFSHLETSGGESWVWSVGQRSTLRVPLTVPGRVRVLLDVSAPHPEQVLTVHARGREVARFDAPRRGAPVSVSFDGTAGTNIVELLVNRYNGNPDRFAERDSRPLALRYGRVLVQALGRDHDLVPLPEGPDPSPTAPQRPSAPPSPPALPELAWGARVDFTSPGADWFLGDGWSGREPSFRWAVAERAAVAFALAEIRAARLVVHALTFEKQRVHVVLNGIRLGTWTVDGKGLRDLELLVPADRLAARNDLVFELPDGKSPKSIGLSDDTRRLGLAVQWLVLEPR